MKLLKTTYYLFVAVFLIIVCLLIASVFPIFNFKVKSVLSGSMEPEIRVGSIIVISPAEYYEIDDVITFQFAGEMPITHRIVGVDMVDRTYRFITKGDANEEPDPRAVYKNEIIGRVLFDIPLIGYLVGFAQTSKGFMLIIVVPATIIIYDEVRKIGKEIIRLKAQKKKKDEEQDEEIDESKERDKEQDEEDIRIKKEIIILKAQEAIKDKKQDKEIVKSKENDKEQDKEIERLKQEIKGLKNK